MGRRRRVANDHAVGNRNSGWRNRRFGCDGPTTGPAFELSNSPVVMKPSPSAACQGGDQDDRQLLREVRRIRHDGARDDARVGRERALSSRAPSPRDTSPDTIPSRSRCALASRSSARSCTSCPLLEVACRLSWSILALSCSTRAPAILASFSSERTSRSASPRICRSRSAICARNSLMRGWLSSSVENCSASCARSVTRCSLSRRISSELMTSPDSIGRPELAACRESTARAHPLRPSASARSQVARSSSPSCLVGQRSLLVPTNRLERERKSSTLASASATLTRSVSISPESHWPAALALVPLRRSAARSDTPRRPRWRRAPRAPDRPTGTRPRSRATCRPETPARAHNKLRERALPASCQRIARDAEQDQHVAQRTDAAQHRIEFGPLGELELADDLARDFARQRELHLAGDRFLIDGRAFAIAVLLGLRPQ